MTTGQPLIDLFFLGMQFILPLVLSIVGPLIGQLIDSLLNPPM